MSNFAVEAALANYDYYKEAFAACALAGLKPKRKRLYKDKAALAAKLHASISEKYNDPGLQNFLQDEARILHDETFQVWKECLKHNLQRCKSELKNYEKNVDGRRTTLRSIQLAPDAAHYQNTIEETESKLTNLTMSPPVRGQYLERWDTSFKDFSDLNATLGKAHAEIYDWVEKASAEQRKKAEKRIALLRLGGAAVGGGGALTAIVAVIRGWLGG